MGVMGMMGIIVLPRTKRVYYATKPVYASLITDF